MTFRSVLKYYLEILSWNIILFYIFVSSVFYALSYNLYRIRKAFDDGIISWRKWNLAHIFFSTRVLERSAFHLATQVGTCHSIFVITVEYWMLKKDGMTLVSICVVDGRHPRYMTYLVLLQKAARERIEILILLLISFNLD